MVNIQTLIEDIKKLLLQLMKDHQVIQDRALKAQISHQHSNWNYKLAFLLLTENQELTQEVEVVGSIKSVKLTSENLGSINLPLGDFYSYQNYIY